MQADELFGTDPSTNWQSTEGRSEGGAGSATVTAGTWRPTAYQNGRELALVSLQVEGNGALARFAAGGRVPAHPHCIDEECLMVEGELFLGDVLLREGGFQRAPGGTAHGELFADSPCLLFFHGAIDPAAVDNAHRAQQGFPAL